VEDGSSCYANMVCLLDIDPATLFRVLWHSYLRKVNGRSQAVSKACPNSEFVSCFMSQNVK
jgi:hypothetical protein